MKKYYAVFDTNVLVSSLLTTGLSLGRTPSKDDFLDVDDIVFYEVALSKEGAYLVTGNQRHFPKSPIVVTPAEMLQIILADAEKE